MGIDTSAEVQPVLQILTLRQIAAKQQPLASDICESSNIDCTTY